MKKPRASKMNVIFRRTGREDHRKADRTEAAGAALVGTPGPLPVGACRVSLYNAANRARPKHLNGLMRRFTNATAAD